MINKGYKILLFADIINSTEIILNLDTEYIYTSFSEIFHSIYKKSKEFNNLQLIERLGDSIYAISNDLEQILEFSRYIKETSFTVVNNNNNNNIDINFRIGMHYSEICYGFLKTDDSGNRFSTFGLGVNICSRIMNCAKKKEIIISDEFRLFIESNLPHLNSKLYSEILISHKGNNKTPIKSIGDIDLYYLLFI